MTRRIPSFLMERQRIWRRSAAVTKLLCRGWAGRTCSFWASEIMGISGSMSPRRIFPGDVHTVQLTQSTIQANSRLFERIEDVPTSAVTMGIGTIMKAKRILLIAGAEKKEIVHEAFVRKGDAHGSGLGAAAAP